MRRVGRSSVGPVAPLAALCVSALLAGAVRAEELEQSFQVGPEVRVEIELLSGGIELRATDGNEVRVRASGDVEIEGGQGGDRVSIHAPSGGWLPWTGGPSRVTRAAIDARAPRSCAVRRSRCATKSPSSSAVSSSCRSKSPRATRFLPTQRPTKRRNQRPSRR